jgi:hypothetical protein
MPCRKPKIPATTIKDSTLDFDLFARACAERFRSRRQLCFKFLLGLELGHELQDAFVHEVFNGRAGSIRQFSEFCHHSLIELVQWREPPEERRTRCFSAAFSCGPCCAGFHAGARKFCLVLDSFPCRICSHEHESPVTPSLGADIAQANRETSTVGIEFMDPALKTLKAALEAIRDAATNALNRAVAGRTFDAMEMQTVLLRKAFHEACFLGNRWQMPPM